MHELCPHGPRCRAGHGALGNPGPRGRSDVHVRGHPHMPEAEDVHAEEPNLLAQAHEKVPYGPQPLERPSFRQNETVRIASYTPVMIPTGPNRVANVSNAAVPTIRPAISLTQKPFVQTLFPSFMVKAIGIFPQLFGVEIHKFTQPQEFDGGPADDRRPHDPPFLT